MFTFHKLLIYFAARVASGGNANALPGRHLSARPAAPRLPWLCAEGRCWPQSWVLGAQKGGSTTLWRWLYDSAGVCGAAGQPSHYDKDSDGKETHFWTERAPDLPAEQRAALFTALYPESKRWECPGGFAEATPDNLYFKQAPWLLRAAMPAALRPALRFVVSLREPIARGLRRGTQARRRFPTSFLPRESSCRSDVPMRCARRRHLGLQPPAARERDVGK